MWFLPIGCLVGVSLANFLMADPWWTVLKWIRLWSCSILPSTPKTPNMRMLPLPPKMYFLQTSHSFATSIMAVLLFIRWDQPELHNSLTGECLLSLSFRLLLTTNFSMIRMDRRYLCTQMVPIWFKHPNLTCILRFFKIPQASYLELRTLLQAKQDFIIGMVLLLSNGSMEQGHG